MILSSFENSTFDRFLSENTTICVVGTLSGGRGVLRRQRLLTVVGSTKWGSGGGSGCAPDNSDSATLTAVLSGVRTGSGCAADGGEESLSHTPETCSEEKRHSLTKSAVRKKALTPETRSDEKGVHPKKKVMRKKELTLEPEKRREEKGAQS